MVFCVFKVYTLFMLNSQSNLFPPLIITKLKHDQEVSTWHEKLYLCYLIPACKIQSLPYCWHTNILLESPSRSYPFNVVLQTLKVPSQGVWPYCAFQHWMGERGCVWANDLWQWLSIRDKLSIWVSHERTWILAGKKGVAIVCHVVLDGGFLSSVQKET